jgi:ParB family chromosome partitioning protein
MVELTEIALGRIRPNRLNPRLDMNIEKLNELASSIKQVGLLEPIIVRPSDDVYEVVVGERRYRASQQAGLQKVPAIIRDFTDEQVIELNLVENIQRDDLSAVEKGNCCKQLLEKYPEKYPSREAIAEKIGVSADTVNNWLKLTMAPSEIQRLVTPVDKTGVPRQLGKLDYSTALTITRQIREPARQVEVARKIAAKAVHGRKAREVVAKAAKEPGKPVEEIVAETLEEPYELLFRSSDKDLVLSGVKTQTTRAIAPDSRVRPDSMVLATVLEPRFAELRVTSVERKRLKYFTEEDAQSEGGYSLKQFRENWEREHGEWNAQQLVYIIRFEKA